MMKDKKTIIIGVIAIIAIIVILLLLKGCGAKEYTVTFDSNGGTPVNSQTIKEGGKATKPSNPTREGYDFDGWYLNLSDPNAYDFNTEVKADLKLIAKWSQKTIESEELSLSSSNVSLKVDETMTLEVNLPDGVTLSDLVWSSSNESIVKVSSNGKLTAIKAGSATITVKTKDGKYSVTCNVTVTGDDVAVTKVSISGSNAVTVGSTITLKATVTPTDATNKKVTWTSSNPKVASVDANGKVKGLTAGTTTIKVCSQENPKICAEKKITVNAKTNTPTTQEEPKNVPVTGIAANPTNVTLYVGENANINANVAPENATNKNVTWTVTSGNNIVSVANGKITALAAGTATVQVCTVDGNKCATINVTVKDKYVITFTEITQAVGGTFQYRVSITKNGVTCDDIKVIKYNNKNHNIADGTMRKDAIDTSITTASVNVGGTFEAASVEYK